LGGDNSKLKLERLFQFLLQFVHDMAAQFDPELKEDEEGDKQGTDTTINIALSSAPKA
jgi:hypothetical protein